MVSTVDDGALTMDYDASASAVDDDGGGAAALGADDGNLGSGAEGRCRCWRGLCADTLDLWSGESSCVIWEEEIAPFEGREYGTGGERGKRVGPWLARWFWLLKVGQRKEEFGQLDGLASCWLVCWNVIFISKIIKIKLKSRVAKLTWRVG